MQQSESEGKELVGNVQEEMKLPQEQFGVFRMD